jgi:hypothetical protein
VGSFIIVSLIWGSIGGVITLFLGFDPQESWWRELIAFTIWFTPMLAGVCLSYLVGSRLSGRVAGTIASVISLGLFVGYLIVGVFAVMHIDNG